MSAGRTAGWTGTSLRWPVLPEPMLHCYLSLGYLQPQHHQGEEDQDAAGKTFYQPRWLLRLRSWSGHDKRLSIPMNIRVFLHNKAARPQTSQPEQRPGVGGVVAPGRCRLLAAEHDPLKDEGADAIGAKASGTLPHGPTQIHVPGTGLVQRGEHRAGRSAAAGMYQARRPVLRFGKGALANGSGVRGRRSSGMGVTDGCQCEVP